MDNSIVGIRDREARPHATDSQFYAAVDRHNLLLIVDALLIALNDATSDLFLQVESKHGPEAASRYPSIAKAKATAAAYGHRGVT